MSPYSHPLCPHERRPGTTVCLHCRHSERLAANVRRRALFTQIGGVVFVIGIVAAAGVAGTAALYGGRSSSQPSAGTLAIAVSRAEKPLIPPPPDAGTPAPSGRTALVTLTPAARSLAEGSPNGTAAPLSVPSTDTVPADSPVHVAVAVPILPEGRTSLPDSVEAIRNGSEVVVRFDRILTRTRRPAKFERIIRSTLPAIYGAVADTALAHWPQGTVERAGDLFTGVPSQGLNIPSRGGSFLVRTEARLGNGGPLVVAYHVRFAP
ncbi:MAG: hypothetical protein NVS4B3_09700 [Gemmatimonadaceae bacterium]